MRVAPEVVSTSQEQDELTKLTCSELACVRLAQRALIVLMAAQGMKTRRLPCRQG